MPDNAVASEAAGGGTPLLSRNLKLRIFSGAVLAAVAFLLAYAGPLPFAVLILVCALVISWEWGRLVRGATFDLGFFVHAIAVTAAIVLAGAGYADFGTTKDICLAPSKMPADMDATTRQRIDEKFAGMLRAKSFVIASASTKKCARLTLEIDNTGRTLTPVVTVERNDRWGSFQPPRPMPEDEALAWLAVTLASRLKPETERS